MKRKLRHPKKPVSTSLPSPASTPGSCRTIGELAEQTRQVYLNLVKPKKNQNRYFAKMLDGRGIYSDASKAHTLYLMFEIDTTSKKLGYDLFMQTYCINPKDLSENAFNDYRRAHNFLMKLRDTRLCDRLKDISISVLLRLIPLLGVLSRPVPQLRDAEENIQMYANEDKALVELYKALLSDKRITVAKMNELVSNIIGTKPNQTQNPVSNSLPPTSAPGSCRTIGELYEQTRQVYFKLVRHKKDKNKYFGKMIAGCGIYSDASKQHTLYLMFEIDPASKKLGYDLFMQTYCINPKDLSKNTFNDYRRGHNFLMKLRDTRLRDRLKDISVSVLLRVIPILDILNRPVTQLRDIEENIPIYHNFDKDLIELYKALLSDKRITVAKMNEFVSNISKKV